MEELKMKPIPHLRSVIEEELEAVRKMRDEAFDDSVAVHQEGASVWDNEQQYMTVLANACTVHDELESLVHHLEKALKEMVTYDEAEKARIDYQNELELMWQQQSMDAEHGA